ncbi:cysteine desulfurase, partial [Microgenomates group bacterium]|nr:cysteine desulfurase [Microgenomates group bacterium]
SNNLAIAGLMRAARAADSSKNHLLLSSIEHDSALQVGHHLQNEGFQVTFLAPNHLGQIEPENLRSAITPHTVLVSILHGHYQFGTLQNLRRLGEVCHQAHVFFHTDASQSFGHQDINVVRDHVDLLTATAAKIYGPKGAALLYLSRAVEPLPQPLVFGGGQEMGLRSATLDTPLIVGFARAAALSRAEAKEENARLIVLRDHLINRVLAEIPNSSLNGHPVLRLPNNAHFSLSGAEGESILLALDTRGIAASTGSACSSRSLEPDHSLLALGLTPAAAHGSLRLTLGKSTTLEDIDHTVDVLKEVVAELRKLSPL